MKKFFTLILAAALSLSLIACGSTTQNNAEESSATETTGGSAQETVVSSSFEEGTEAAKLADLYNQGYITGAICNNEGVTTVNYINADHTDYMQATCSMTGQQLDDFFALDSMAEDYAQQCFDALTACEDLKVVAATLPDSSEYDSYVGKTVQDMIDSGFDFAGYNDDENGKLILEFYVYPENGETYMIHAIPEGNPDDDGSYDDETVLKLKVETIMFWEFA